MSRSRERSHSGNFRRNDRSNGNSKSRSQSNRDSIRHYKCREYDLFTKDCPTMAREERES